MRKADGFQPPLRLALCLQENFGDMLNPRLATAIGLIAIVCLLIAVKMTTDLKGLISSLSLGFVISAIFYFLVVFFPERSRRNLYHNSLERQFEEFRLSCIGIFLILSGSQGYQHKRNLLDQAEFRRYFKNSDENGIERWDAVAEGLEANRYYLRDIVHELRMLNDELKFFRSSVHFHDSQVHDFLHRLSKELARLENTEPHYDDIKSFCQFLWSIFTGWSWIEGYSKVNIVEDVINRAK